MLNRKRYDFISEALNKYLLKCNQHLILSTRESRITSNIWGKAEILRQQNFPCWQRLRMHLHMLAKVCYHKISALPQILLVMCDSLVERIRC